LHLGSGNKRKQIRQLSLGSEIKRKKIRRLVSGTRTIEEVKAATVFWKWDLKEADYLILIYNPNETGQQ